MTTQETNWVDAIGKPAFDSIAEMVAALKVDRERLEELREERDNWEPETDEDGSPAYGFEVSFEETDEGQELAELEDAAGDTESEDDARERIQDDPLSLRIFGERTNGEWEADRFELLLTTGGPAVRIMGEIGSHGEASRAWLEVQDWGKAWTQYFCDSDTLLTYCNVFCFE